MAAAGKLFDATFEGFQLLRSDFDRRTATTNKCKAEEFAALGYRYLTLRLVYDQFQSLGNVSLHRLEYSLSTS